MKAAADGGAPWPHGRVAGLYRHPVKGFTPERLDRVALGVGLNFPGDRLYAVERGQSGFDPEAPKHLSKWHFAVLANHPRLAQVVTRYDPASAVLDVACPSRRPALRVTLSTAEGREAFGVWLAGFLGEDETERLRVVACSGAHRFTDDAEGFVSLVNLESLRDLGTRLGTEIDPLRLRANLYIEGWPAGAELDLDPGARLALGEAELEAIKPIPRCIATHVDPGTGVRDLDLLAGLRAHYGHVLCGLYLRVTGGGRVGQGDTAILSHASEMARPCPAPLSPPPWSKPGPPRATA